VGDGKGWVGCDGERSIGSSIGGDVDDFNDNEPVISNSFWVLFMLACLTAPVVVHLGSFLLRYVQWVIVIILHSAQTFAACAASSFHL